LDTPQGKDQADEKDALSITDEATLLEYLQCFNATEAWVRIHPKCTRESAMRLGSRWLRKVEVQTAISEYFKAKQMDVDEVLGRLAEQARASHEPFIQITNDGFVYFDFSNPEARQYLHLIKKIKTKRQRLVEGKGDDVEIWEHEWVEVELHDQQRALELIGKHLKLFADSLDIHHTLRIDGMDAMLDKVYGNDRNPKS
jgi:phage terminase small subunit